MSITDGRLLLDDLDSLRKLIHQVRPPECCQGAIMKERGKRDTQVCSADCKWQKIDLLLATSIINAERVVLNP